MCVHAWVCCFALRCQVSLRPAAQTADVQDEMEIKKRSSPRSIRFPFFFKRLRLIQLRGWFPLCSMLIAQKHLGGGVSPVDGRQTGRQTGAHLVCCLSSLSRSRRGHHQGPLPKGQVQPAQGVHRPGLPEGRVHQPEEAGAQVRVCVCVHAQPLGNSTQKDTHPVQSHTHTDIDNPHLVTHSCTLSTKASCQCTARGRFTAPAVREEGCLFPHEMGPPAVLMRM